MMEAKNNIKSPWDHRDISSVCEFEKLLMQVIFTQGMRVKVSGESQP